MLWKLVADWLGFSTTFHGSFFNHLHQFGRLRGFSKAATESMNIIWLSVVWVICKERNNSVFQRKEEMCQVLCENVKLQSCWWLKSKYVTFDIDYQLWKQIPLACSNSIF